MENDKKTIDDGGRAIEEKKKLAKALCGLALSDNLGDVREAESELWSLLGINAKVEIDYDDVWGSTKSILQREGLLPEHFL